MTLRTVLPQASRDERPTSLIMRIALAASVERDVVELEVLARGDVALLSGVYCSATSAKASICSGVTPPKGSFTRIICTSGWRWP